MIRIGFDPLLEAEQRHQELIKEVEQYRLAYEGLSEAQSRLRSGFKFLALIGREIASLGASLEERYGDNAQSGIALNPPVNSDGCR